MSMGGTERAYTSTHNAHPVLHDAPVVGRELPGQADHREYNNRRGRYLVYGTLIVKGDLTFTGTRLRRTETLVRNIVAAPGTPRRMAE